ncbi:MAG: thioredoxin-dependent thiol peroxidase [Candidatus Diapherotrites archaeon]|nr:thioredoxin-dependent thiol peroxidase [Candidatus Diapherotrites archaeon]
MLEIGKNAPELAVLNQHNKQVRLVDFKGQWLVIYFYPKDFTPGCTLEGCDFAAAYSEFKSLNCEVLGVSPDSVDSHKKFAIEHKIEFSLLADTESKVCKAYSVWGQKNVAGKFFLGVNRTTFIIGPDGLVKEVFRNVQPKNHVQEVLTKLKYLQM